MFQAEARSYGTQQGYRILALAPKTEYRSGLKNTIPHCELQRVLYLPDVRAHPGVRARPMIPPSPQTRYISERHTYCCCFFAVYSLADRRTAITTFVTKLIDDKMRKSMYQDKFWAQISEGAFAEERVLICRI